MWSVRPNKTNPTLKLWNEWAFFVDCQIGANVKIVDWDATDKGCTTDEEHHLCEKIFWKCERIVGHKPPKKVSQLLHPDCHPELDNADIADTDAWQICWSLIGMLKWAVTLERLDIHHMTRCISSFMAQLNKGHVEAVLKIFRFLCNCRFASIDLRTDIPDCSEIEKKQPTECDWS